jgi:uncharacterized protein (TIGR03435 family)
MLTACKPFGRNRRLTFVMFTIPPLLPLILAGAIAQAPDAALKFEVASVKPSPPDAVRGSISGGPGTRDPGLYTCENINLTNLVRIAFDLPDYRFSGPDWMRSKRFNISARVPEGTTSEQFRSMLQSLLIERFHLVFHFEGKEMQTYDLIVARNGHKLKESPPEADGAVPPPSPQPAGPPKPDSEGFPILPAGRQRAVMELEDGHVAIRWVAETMDRLASYLSAQLRMPVHDATGLKGVYDFTMRWISGTPPSGGESGPNLFRAVQEQLGLRLEGRKTIVEIFVVDAADKAPTEN